MRGHPEALRSSCQVWHYEAGDLATAAVKGRVVGNIGKEAQEIEVLPAEQEQPAPAERERAPSEPMPPEHAPAPAAEPAPARA
jgi:hypothetical protein